MKKCYSAECNKYISEYYKFVFQTITDQLFPVFPWKKNIILDDYATT